MAAIRLIYIVRFSPAAGRWMVADRGVDGYDQLRQCRQQGLGFVRRAAQDRGLVAPPDAAPQFRTPPEFRCAHWQQKPAIFTRDLLGAIYLTHCQG